MEEAPKSGLSAVTTRFHVGCLLLVEIQSLWMRLILPEHLMRGLVTDSVKRCLRYCFGIASEYMPERLEVQVVQYDGKGTVHQQ